MLGNTGFSSRLASFEDGLTARDGMNLLLALGINANEMFSKMSPQISANTETCGIYTWAFVESKLG